MGEVLLAALILALAICHGSGQAAPSPPAGTTTPTAAPIASQEYLEAHNQARAEVGVSPLKWSEKLANATSLQVRYQRDKQGCKFANLAAGKYGGNQLMASGAAVTPREAVETWVAEKKYYTYANNSCAPDHRCGVYTQVIWRKTVELGCAQATCAKDQTSLTICFYNPPGNVVGESPY
ncbi:hypothetical protein RJ639_005626 [Escallonia herrerae]|uniref:SCP domain-containing protein n=1 Tax=Escallonia herrerae TaxID=1293975 RepID=A0AA88VW76_9ASTE|nr:hypothetical protein RJ639_005626 [Escallonia herrerae]